MNEETLQLGDQSTTDPDHPIGDPPEDTSGGQGSSGGPRPMPGGDDQ